MTGNQASIIPATRHLHWIFALDGGVNRLLETGADKATMRHMTDYIPAAVTNGRCGNSVL